MTRQTTLRCRPDAAARRPTSPLASGWNQTPAGGRNQSERQGVEQERVAGKVGGGGVKGRSPSPILGLVPERTTANSRGSRRMTRAGVGSESESSFGERADTETREGGRGGGTGSSRGRRHCASRTRASLPRSASFPRRPPPAPPPRPVGGGPSRPRDCPRRGVWRHPRAQSARRGCAVDSASPSFGPGEREPALEIGG